MSTVRETLVDHYGAGWQRQIDHVASVAEDRRYTYVNEVGKTYPTMHVDTVDVLCIAHTTGRSLQGYEDTVDIANYRVLRDQWSDVEGLTDGPYSGASLIALDLDSDSPEDLIEVLESLAAYPLLSDDEHSTVEQEMIAEHWELYGRDDVLRKVADVLGVDTLDLSNNVAGIVETLAFCGVLHYGYSDGYPEIIDPSAVNFGEDEIARWIGVRAMRGGMKVSVKTNNGYGERILIDLREDNLIDRPVWRFAKS